MANNNGFIYIAGVKEAVTDEIPIINVTAFEVNYFIQGHHVYRSIWRRIQGRVGAKQHSCQLGSVCTEKQNY